MNRIPNRREGFTLIELLVAISIIAVLIALTIPAAQRVRDTANRISDANNQRQLVMALHGYHDSHRKFPKNGTQSFYVAILPYVDQANNTPSNPQGVSLFTCPGRRRPSLPYADYAGALPFNMPEYVYPDPYYTYDGSTNPPTYTYHYKIINKFMLTVLGSDDQVSLDEIQDGASNTFMLTNKYVATSDYRGFNGRNDLAWSEPGPPVQPMWVWQGQTTVYRYPWYTIIQPVPVAVQAQTFQSINTKRGAGQNNVYYSVNLNFTPDMQMDASGALDANFGSPFVGAIQPVAFADGSVRNLSFIPTSIFTIHGRDDYNYSNF